MAYKDKLDIRYRQARMRWYFKNQEAHRQTSIAIIQTKREYLQKLKESTPCLDCNQKYPYYVMDFDHRDRKKKNFNLGYAYEKSWQKIKDEVDKCDLICANCHRIRTYRNNTAHSSIG
jgi:hypothetical protein